MHVTLGIPSFDLRSHHSGTVYLVMGPFFNVNIFYASPWHQTLVNGIKLNEN
jgi:hypothetical protein